MIGFTNSPDKKQPEGREGFIAFIEPALRDIAGQLVCLPTSAVPLKDSHRDNRISEVFGLCISQYIKSFSTEVYNKMGLSSKEELEHRAELKQILTNIVNNL